MRVLRNLLCLLLVAVIFSTVALSQTTTPNLSLSKPVRSSVNWDTLINGNFDVIDASISGLQQSYQGAWIAGKTYSKGQLVMYGNVVYQSKIASNTANLPTNTTAWLPFLSLTSDSITGYLGYTPLRGDTPYSDPTWITSLNASKLSGSVSNPSWLATVAGSKIAGAVANATNATHASSADTAASASVATALANTPGNCATGQAMTGLTADGIKTCGTVATSAAGSARQIQIRSASGTGFDASNITTTSDNNGLNVPGTTTTYGAEYTYTKNVFNYKPGDYYNGMIAHQINDYITHHAAGDGMHYVGLQVNSTIQSGTMNYFGSMGSVNCIICNGFMNASAINVTGEVHSPIQGGNWLGIGLNQMAPGDTMLHTEIVGYTGCNRGTDECTKYRRLDIHNFTGHWGGHVATGGKGTPDAYGQFGVQLVDTCTNCNWAWSRESPAPIIDKSTVTSAGNITAMTYYPSVGTPYFIQMTTDLDLTPYGNSTITQLTASAPADGYSVNCGNCDDETGTGADLSNFTYTVGNAPPDGTVVMIWDPANVDFVKTHRIDATHFSGKLHYPFNVGAWVSWGGVAGLAISNPLDTHAANSVPRTDFTASGEDILAMPVLANTDNHTIIVWTNSQWNFSQANWPTNGPAGTTPITAMAGTVTVAGGKATAINITADGNYGTASCVVGPLCKLPMPSVTVAGFTTQPNFNLRFWNDANKISICSSTSNTIATCTLSAAITSANGGATALADGTYPLVVGGFTNPYNFYQMAIPYRAVKWDPAYSWPDGTTGKWRNDLGYELVMPTTSASSAFATPGDSVTTTSWIHQTIMDSFNMTRDRETRANRLGATMSWQVGPQFDGQPMLALIQPPVQPSNGYAEWYGTQANNWNDWKGNPGAFISFIGAYSSGLGFDVPPMPNSSYNVNGGMGSIISVGCGYSVPSVLPVNTHPCSDTNFDVLWNMFSYYIQGHQGSWKIDTNASTWTLSPETSAHNGTISIDATFKALGTSVFTGAATFNSTVTFGGALTVPGLTVSGAPGTFTMGNGTFNTNSSGTAIAVNTSQTSGTYKTMEFCNTSASSQKCFNLTPRFASSFHVWDNEGGSTLFDNTYLTIFNSYDATQSNVVIETTLASGSDKTKPAISVGPGVNWNGAASTSQAAFMSSIGFGMGKEPTNPYIFALPTGTFASTMILTPNTTAASNLWTLKFWSAANTVQADNVISANAAGNVAIGTTADGTYNFKVGSIMNMNSSTWNASVSGTAALSGGSGATQLSMSAVGGTLTGTWNLTSTGTATSGANFSSNYLGWNASYWTGSASNVDNWSVRALMGTGSNPTSYLNFTHTGTTGTAALQVPGLISTGNISAPNLVQTTSANGSISGGTTISAGACSSLLGGGTMPSWFTSHSIVTFTFTSPPNAYPGLVGNAYNDGTTARAYVCNPTSSNITVSDLLSYVIGVIQTP